MLRDCYKCAGCARRVSQKNVAIAGIPAQKNPPVHPIVRKLAGVFPPRRNAWRAALAALLLWTPVCAPAASPLLKLPLLDGEMSGVLAMPQNGLEFHWRFTAESPKAEPGIRRGRFEVDGQGAHLVARVKLDLSSRTMQWEIEKAGADLAEFFPLAAPEWLPDFAHLSVTGTVSAEGRGQLTSAGDFSGAVAVTVTDATVRDFFAGWSAEGLSGRVEFPSLPAFETATEQRFTLRRFSPSAANIEIRDAVADVSYDRDGRIHFSSTKFTAYGGVIGIAPFSFDPKAPAVATSVRVEGIDSASLAAFLPGGIAEANGRFSGELALRWSPETGVVPGVGQLRLIKAPDSAIRLSSAPGFFTSNMQPRLFFLPPSLGFLQRVFSLKNPAYDTLKQIEEGKMPIAVDAITINFTPDGDEKGRSASVVIAARPSDPRSAVKNLRINVNVTGPLTEVLRMGTASRVQIGF